MVEVLDNTTRPIKDIPISMKLPSFLREINKEIPYYEYLPKVNVSDLNNVVIELQQSVKPSVSHPLTGHEWPA